jgi:hypothetical protein
MDGFRRRPARRLWPARGRCFLAVGLVAAGFWPPAAFAPRAEAAEIVPVTPETFLAEVASRRAADGSLGGDVSFVLAPGLYELQPYAAIDSACGNCSEPATSAAATVGLLISGRRIEIWGHGPRTVIHTGAGYGLLFRRCRECLLQGVTVTGGVRDPDGNATDAGVVVQESSLRIEGCLIRDNLGDSTIVAGTVVGIMGVAGRDGADLEIVGNTIARNSWDGIALYRGARARIVDNLIDGVDKATGALVGGGRGVGIGVTWNAEAEVRHNVITRYWKGVGVFVDAKATISENVIEDIVTWGVAYWDAGRGRPQARIENNVIDRTGACGIAITRAASDGPEPGCCRGNVIARTGRNAKYDDPESYCRQCPVALEAVPPGFTVADNLFWSNRRVGDCTEAVDLDTSSFIAAAGPLLMRLHRQSTLSLATCWQDLPAPR